MNDVITFNSYEDLESFGRACVISSPENTLLSLSQLPACDRGIYFESERGHAGWIRRLSLVNRSYTSAYCRLCPPDSLPIKLRRNIDLMGKHFREVHILKSADEHVSVVNFHPCLEHPVFDAIVDFVVENHLRLGIFEGKAFANLIRVFFDCIFQEKGQQPPFSFEINGLSKYFVRKSLEIAANRTREKIQIILNAAPYVHVMADGWSAHDITYIGVLAIIPDGHRLLLDLRSYEGGKKAGAAESAAILEKVYSRYGILNKPSPFGFSAFICDSCVTNRATVKQAAFLRSGATFFCASHLLHLALIGAIDFVPCVANFIDSVRDASKLLRSDNQAALWVLNSFNRRTGKSFAKAGLLDVPTRWSSMYMMLQRFVDLSQDIHAFLIADHLHRIQSATGLMRTGVTAKRWKATLDLLSDTNWIEELKQICHTMSKIHRTLNNLQSGESGLPLAYSSIQQLKNWLNHSVRGALALENYSGELSTWSCLSKRHLMTPSIAFKAATLFQVSHRFGSQIARSNRIVCPAVTAYNGPDVARYSPPPSWRIDDLEPIVMHQTRSITRRYSTPRGNGDDFVGAAGSRRTGVHGRRRADTENGTAQETSRRIPVNPAADEQFFADTLAAVDTTFPRPYMPLGFDMTDQAYDSYARAAALFALAV